VDHARRILIWGAGGHAKVVADVARACGWEIAGHADSAPDQMQQIAEPGGARVIVTEPDLLRLLASDQPLPGDATALVLAFGDNRMRNRHSAKVPESLLPVLVHPTAEISPSVTIGAGTVIMPRAVINASSTIGRACIINTGAIIEHDCVIGDAAHISPGAILLGGVHVGNESWVGARAVVRTGISIGADCMVGMGAVVVREVPDHVTVVGNPARELGAPAGR
jgi:sugar O-acyltransferase (sialic acid O-acetyltransferase NeuD family)